MIANVLPLLELDCPCDEAIKRVKCALEDGGLRLMISFDSHLTRIAKTSVACPHHGMSACDCRIVILLVYDEESQPATLLAHGQDGATWISMVDTPGQRPLTGLEKGIKGALVPLSTVRT
mgnify:FL=1